MHTPQRIHIGAALHPALMGEAEQIRRANTKISRIFLNSPRFTYQLSKNLSSGCIVLKVLSSEN
jgi:hypothetical protein